jgi:glutathione S-transferase
MITLYDTPDSGNCYKVRLTLNQLEIPFDSVSVDIMKGETRADEYLALNPNGRVPMLVLEDGTPLSESNAIICHLARGSHLRPSDPVAEAQMLAWMFFEQYSHEPYIATTRFWLYFLKDAEGYAEQIARNMPRGYAALDVMEKRLAQHEFLVGESYSLADIALYAYTHVADEGGFELGSYSGILRWLDRVRGQHLHIPMERIVTV